ncbi:nucleobase-ascorbate transporter 12 isoform X2 [Telopea speciosissima]|uniref:nucleobase-ascorbate transporter 12 isoform X2 n=1 Tax=Telopea speciosissima TaxID=54955 RepID=UPI001CC539A9|nr:nucleobase-ascorbate transporter 12 isoform X2 [Telopea speciosissima]
MASSDPTRRPRPGPWPPAPETNAMPSSWAKRTGFRARFSGETNASDSGQIVAVPKPKEAEPQVDLESGRARPPLNANGEPESEKIPVSANRDQSVKKRRETEGTARSAAAPSTNGQVRSNPPPPPSKPSRDEEVVDVLPQSIDDEGFVARHSHMKYELRDSPGLVPIGLYGLQHYLSMLGSLILIPLVIVPAMGGSHNFRHIMKELQGAIIISSAFQAILGYSGLMSVFLRLINPVVVAPTIAAVGLSFYSYGFPQVGNCIEIGTVQILLVIIFSLYLRKISVFGHRIFLIYAVPLGLAITWAVAFLLTEVGAYNYKGCDVNVPASNIISEACRKHVSRMKYCRVDTSHALKSSPWFRFPYPLQWGTPVFDWKMASVMSVVSIIASVDSVGSYHASSLLVTSRPPTPGVLSRGIGLEGLSSILAGLWGTGTGSMTLTENVHTIAVTKMGSRRSVELGACILILLSLVGKVGGFIASIPDVMVAALLCFMWAMLAALGLSNLRYSEAGSSRNIIIVGLSLFFSLSIPAYFQQYGAIPNANSSVPSYFQPYIVASHGPIHTKYGGLNYVLNTLLSFHMVIAFLIAVILDNTVPGSRQERGVYVWSEPESASREPAVVKDYGLPFRVGRVFRWVKWVGL